ncbi:hypothetical protein PoB_005029100 [Plakobranchus ocellatus]|uniref:Uncharacterized protein n=1 Tax=Plakobranchus ocellatus TaxID=259542 RepID=A0AAV4BKE4_9GAST|nr:hypothetical protein PoB_005029100 [Plakobranchus ocellatus]
MTNINKFIDLLRGRAGDVGGKLVTNRSETCRDPSSRLLEDIDGDDDMWRRTLMVKITIYVNEDDDGDDDVDDSDGEGGGGGDDDDDDDDDDDYDYDDSVGGDGDYNNNDDE